MCPPEIPWIVVALVALCFPFLTNLLDAVGGSFSMLFSEARRRELVCRINFKQSVDVTYIFALLAYTLLLVVSGASHHGTWYTLGVLAGWAILREVILFVVKKRSVNPTVAADTGRFFRSIFILCTLLSGPVAVLPFAAPDTVPVVTTAILGGFAGIALLTYLIKSYKVFLTPKFSHISSLLYLCGLDLLPIAGAVYLLV